MSIHKLVVVGGVAGGASCAARARRLNEEAEIVLLERGPYVSFANCGLPYHIGGVIEQRDRLLVQTPERLKKMFRLDVRVRHEVIRIDRENHQVGVRDRATGREYTESYDALALSPGAEPVRPPIPGVESARVCTLRNMEDMDGILSILGESSTRSAVVVGGGYIGLEMAEALCERGLKVALVELAPQVMGPADAEMAAPLHDELQRHGVNLRLETSVSAFQETENGLEVQLSTGDTLTCELAILAIGVKPEVRLAREAGLKIGALGGIAVDEYLRTSDPAIYAVGDAIETRDFVGGGAALLPLAGPANRQGRLVADHLFGHPRPWRGTQGTAICKVFGLAIAMTGSSEKVLKRQGRTYEKIYVHPAHHAGYYPGATQFSLKLLFDPTDGRVLGAQAVGARGVDKRIDVLATAIQSGMTVFDLEETELSYAPPYGSAKDPVNFAAFVAANVLRGDMKVCHVEEVSDPQPHQWLLDVRTGAEVAAGAIPGAHNISVDELRSHLDEIPRDREILVYCQVGLRGYLASRILTQKGFNCRNLTGGYKTYLMARQQTGKLPAAPLQDDSGVKSGGSRSVPAGTAPAGGNASCCAVSASPVAKRVDARGLQCPGPILALKEAVDSLQVGESVEILTSDTAFCSDLPAWCRTTGHTLVEVSPMNGGGNRSVVRKAATASGSVPAACSVSPSVSKGMTIVVFSNDFDRAVAAFIIANGAVAMGLKPTLFFTFWGINILRRDNPPPVRKTLVEKMFGWMMPRGPEKLALSKMQMAGMGLAMIKGIMRQKKIPALGDLIQSARQGGARLVVCSMSMDLMGIKREELIEGVEEGGVAMYLGAASTGQVNLFI